MNAPLIFLVRSDSEDGMFNWASGAMDRVERMRGKKREYEPDNGPFGDGERR